MKANQWLQLATMACALAIAGTAAANDQNMIGSKEQAGAAVNSNGPAQLGTNAENNTAAQLGTDTPKATVPSESDAAPTGTDVDTSKQMAKHPPTNRMDEATPTEKTPSDKPAAKHPPTARMDAAMPDQKSPTAAQYPSGRGTRQRFATKPVWRPRFRPSSAGGAVRVPRESCAPQ